MVLQLATMVNFGQKMVFSAPWWQKNRFVTMATAHLTSTGILVLIWQ